MTVAPALSTAKRSLLESYLHARIRQNPLPLPGIPKRNEDLAAPLTLSQEQLVRREINTPNVPLLYNECIQLRMRGPLDVSALQKSFNDIVRRHDIWRTSYDIENGDVRQVVHSAAEPIEIRVVDLEGLCEADQEAAIEMVIGHLAQQPFDLRNGPLLRTHFIKLSDLEHRLYVVAHLSIVDGVSVYQIFPKEVAINYRAHVFGRAPELSSLPIQFADYSHWQRKQLEGASFIRTLEYWQTQLSHLTRLNWPTDRPRPERESFRGKIEKFVLAAPVTDAMKSLAKTEGVTLFMVALSALASLLHLYTRQDDFTIGTPSPSGRKRSDVQDLIGYFLTPVALRFRFTRNMTFRELLRQAQRVTLEAISNDELPVEVLAQRLNLPVDHSRNPLFTVATSLQPTMPALDFDWTVTSMDISSGGSPWDLYLAPIDGKEGLMGRVQYNPDLFNADTVTRFIAHYTNLIQVISENPEIRISAIGLG